MLKAVLDVAVPALVFLTMAVLGSGLTGEDFRRVARRPGLVAAATAGQLLVVPLLAAALVRALPLKPHLSAGVVLVASCPVGPMANLYTRLARGDVALSVTLTAVSCLAAVPAMPLLLWASRASLPGESRFPVPVALLAGQLLLLLVVPVLLGMALRRYRPDFARRHEPALLWASVAALAALLGFVIVQEAGHFVGEAGGLSLGVAFLTASAMMAGYGTGWAWGGSARERRSLAMAFVVRNVGVATAVAVTVLGRVEFAVFATAYFLIQAPLLLSAALLFRLGLPADRGATGEGARS
jgi:bile acid:Na+ symporter, BASS family